MSKDHFIIGTFSLPSAANNAITEIKKLGTDVSDELEFYSPFPDHHLEDNKYDGKKRSPVRRFTLLGATTGCLGAFLFTSWMSLDYPIRVSAKPILSYPAFVVIAFECTILLGGIFTLLSMFHFCRLPNFSRPVSFKREFTEDKFGVVVKVNKDKASELEKVLMNAGAEKVELQYAG